MFRAMQAHALASPLVRADLPQEVHLTYFKRLGAEASVGLTVNK